MKFPRTASGGRGHLVRKITASLSTVALAMASLSLVVAAPASAEPTDLYVNGATGNDSWACTLNVPTPTETPSNGPCKTIQAAITKAAAGDTINVAAGTYTQTATLTVESRSRFLGANTGKAGYASDRSPRASSRLRPRQQQRDYR